MIEPKQPTRPDGIRGRLVDIKICLQVRKINRTNSEDMNFFPLIDYHCVCVNCELFAAKIPKHERKKFALILVEVKY